MRRVVLAVLLLASPLASAQEPSRDDADKKIEALQAEVARLQAAGDTAGRLAELERRIDLLAAELEKTRTGGATEVEAPEKGEPGLGPAASKIYSKAKGVSIGGYGEALYERPAAARQDGSDSGAIPRVDMLRYITYLGYKFSDKILLNSEIEFEHASTGEGAEERGEASVEFAYLEFRPWKHAGFRAGELLLPLGFLNELHEPPIFLGARRNEVERQIIPTTWPENGLGVFGEAKDFQARAYVVAGLDSAGFDAEGIREGRQKASQSKARNWAFTGRLDYVGLPGFLLGASVFTGHSGQGASVDGQAVRAPVTLFDVHAQYESRGLQARVLYARSTVGDVPLVDAANGLGPDETVGMRQYGFYAQAGYDLMSLRPAGSWSVIAFVRYERLNPQDRVPAGFEADPALDRTIWTAGASVKPLANVALKADYQWVRNEARTGTGQFNLGVGFLF